VQIDIRGKVIVITGAGRGLGRALALGLAAEGARVAVLARDGQQAARTVAEIAAMSPATPEPFGVAADVADEAQVRAAAAAVEAHLGRVDALICNAGWMPPVTGVLELNVADLHRVVDSNLISCFLTTKHFAPIMIRGGGGRIIYMTSMIGVQANPGQSAYGATKAGVNILASVAHQELADHGIRTVALAPEREPQDVVSFAAFVCSDAASHLSGTLLPIRPAGG
jgi:NAD(P)-dependent dehydrogenase (short-subunit alcohol dehydrogenase family)